MQHELPNRSAVGAIFVNRQATGDLAGDRDYNRSYAVDARVGFGQNGLVNGFVARTQTPGLSGDQHAFNIGTTHNTEKWRLGAGYAEVGDNFNPEVGFLSRDNGFRKAEFSVNRNIRLQPGSFWKFHELRPHVGYDSYWNFDGLLESSRVHLDQHWQFRAGHEFHTGMNLTREGVTTPFEIYPGVIVPVGNYEHSEAQLVAFTNQGAPVSARMRLTFGGFFGGSRVVTAPQVLIRLSDVFNTEVIWTRNDVELSGGAFVTNLISSRVSYCIQSARVRSGAAAVQRQGQSLVEQRPFRLAQSGEHGALRRVQRHAGARRFDADARGSEPDDQVQPPGRFAELIQLTSLSAGGNVPPLFP